MSRLKYMGQVMAECDCQHRACEVRGYCMAQRIEELEADLKYWQADALRELIVHTHNCVKKLTEELKGQDDDY